MKLIAVRHRFARLMRDMKGVVNPAYLIGYVGQGMYRRSVRRTGIIGLATLTVSIVGRGVGLLPGFTPRKAVIATLIYGVVTLLGGLSLKTISNMLMSERINIAQANNLNLLEDKKKSRLHVYLRRLYDSVFRFEAAMRYAEEEIEREEQEIRKNAEEIAEKLRACLSDENLRFLGVERLCDLVEHMSVCNPLKPRQLECSWEGFRITASYALTHPLPAALEADIIGFDLTMMEDWLDGACFDATDVKLLEQYKANSTLRRIKGLVGFNLRDKVWQWSKVSSHSFWFHNTFRTLAISIGTEIKKLNKKVGRAYFKAEHFLWIHPDLDRLVKSELGEGALQDLTQRRKRLIWKIFSPKYEHAVELLRRIYRPKIELAIDLRKRFDVEYVLGELNGYSYSGDLKRLAVPPKLVRREHTKAQRAKESDGLLTSFLSDTSPELSDLNLLQKRALRIAVHLNLLRVRDLLTEHYASPMSGRDERLQADRAETILRILSGVTADEARFSHWLVTLRTFCLLTWLEFDEYCRQLKEIAYTDQNAHTSTE